jgi:hypothetical protein
MTAEEFHILDKQSILNGAIPIEDIVAVNCLETFDTVCSYSLSETFKRESILPYLKHSSIVYMDKYGNGYNNMIF